MRIILWTFIFSISIVLSLISSGIEHRMFVRDWYIPLLAYFGFFALMGYITFKIRFKNVRILKFFLFRKLLSLNKAFHLIDSKIYSEKIDLSAAQEKSLKMWNKLLKDPNVELQTCNVSGRRIIKRGSLICILKSTMQESNLVIMQNNGVKIFYDIFMPQKNANEMTNSFDSIQEKRINLLIEKEKESIENILESF
jgi:hypothetical protein